MSDGKYEADTGALRRSIASMQELPQVAGRLLSTFREQERLYTPWPGWTDDYAKKARPQWDRNNQTCADIAAGFQNALLALTGATLGALGNIAGTQGDALNVIHQEQSKLGGGDAPNGNGRH